MKIEIVDKKKTNKKKYEEKYEQIKIKTHYFYWNW